ncbi:peptidoglycan bridge formation glycyltransferase FemA/FemB family protein [Weissella halotolerans]|uniref:Aminoacyltransferase FemA n=1 Tax=Weissella halotolerans DSM 20190 TaxID=1123500 RepID=A0A0R2G1C2_9LACO|nr:peptidoglycan bridge formation glycyltransferase FemA/FemB family protein [Weissella halotolerans]KRN31212.1 hypothetical protein IV68_GL001094 [Weissella halotolerans DSM 20190]
MLIPLTVEEWDEFEQQHLQGSMAQTVKQYNLLKQRGRTVEILGLKKENKLVAGAVVTIDSIHGGTIINIDHGPLLDYSNEELSSHFFSALKKYALKKKGLFIRFSPNLVYQRFDNNGGSVTEPNEQVMNNLEHIGAQHLGFKKGMVTEGALRWQYSKNIKGMDSDDLEASYDSKVKYYLKKNKQFGVHVRRLKRDELKDFKKLTADTADRIGFQDKDLQFYQTVFDVYGQDANFIVAEMSFQDYISEEETVIRQLDDRLATLDKRLEVKETKKNRRQYNEFEDQKKQHIKRIEKVKELFNGDVPIEKQIIAGALFIEQPQEMAYLYSGMYGQYKDYYGPYLLQDTMLKKSIEDNIPLYNFLGITGHFDGKDGVFKFKTEFNGQAEEMIGEFDYPIRPVKFAMYKLIKKIIQR